MKDKGRESGRILEYFWLGFPRRLRQRAASNKNAVSQGAGEISTDRMSGSQQDRCFVQVKSNSWTREQQSKCSPHSAPNSSAAEELEECSVAGRHEGKVPVSFPPIQNQKLGCNWEGHLECYKVMRECLGQKGVAVPSGTHREHRKESPMESAKRMAAGEQQGLGKSPMFQRHQQKITECSGLEGT